MEWALFSFCHLMNYFSFTVKIMPSERCLLFLLKCCGFAGERRKKSQQMWRCPLSPEPFSRSEWWSSLVWLNGLLDVHVHLLGVVAVAAVTFHIPHLFTSGRAGNILGCLSHPDSNSLHQTSIMPQPAWPQAPSTPQGLVERGRRLTALL